MDKWQALTFISDSWCSVLCGEFLHYGPTVFSLVVFLHVVFISGGVRYKLNPNLPKKFSNTTVRYNDNQ